jgi:hypothetical protein
MKALHEWYNQITEHITASGLINLAEYKTEEGNKPFEYFTDITRSKQALQKFSYSDFKHGEEFLFLSQDLIYIMAIVELLQPYINNSIKEGGSYNQTLEDHLYLRYAGNGFQIIYSFWDRIGDILALFFQTGQTGDVYLARVFNNFPAEYKSETFHELFKLYKTDVEPVLQDRHGVVHTFGLKTKYRWEALEKNQSESDLEKLQNEKDSYPPLFRNQLSNIFIGFKLTMQLIAELPDKEVVKTGS